jgi:hypothetical protein
LPGSKPLLAELVYSPEYHLQLGRPQPMIEEVRFAPDSLVEEDGFELSVPGRERVSLSVESEPS